MANQQPQQPQQWPSLLEPRVPALDPRTYRAPGHLAFRSLARPTDGDLDRLYLTETAQLQYLGGLRTWEAAQLHLPRSYWAEEHRQWAAASVLRPDEESWFAVFTRSHWLVTDDRILDKYPSLRNYGYTDEDTWSPDNDRIWEELCKVIQLANTLLNLAAEGEWLQNTLTMQWTMLDVPPQICFRTEVPCNPVGDRLTAQAVRQLIDSDNFHSRVRWRLTVSPPQSRLADFSGMTIPDDYDHHCLTLLNVDQMQSLLDPTVSAIEKATARFGLATTMLHELAHCMVTFVRSQFPNANQYPVFVSNQPSDYHEPFYGNEDIAESGHSFVQSTFGTDFTFKLPWVDEWPENSFIGRHWLAIAHPWPEHGHRYKPKTNSTPFRGARTFGLEHNAVSPVISGWVCQLQRQDFWNSDVRRFGPKAVLHPNILAGEDFKFYEPFRYSYTSHAKFDLEKMPDRLSSMHRYAKTAMNNISEARKKWRRLRPWQPDTRLRWSVTPWGHVQAREHLSTLTNSFTLPRTYRKEDDAMRSINEIGLERKEYFQVEPKPDDFDHLTLPLESKADGLAPDALHRCFKALFYTGISYWAYASLPARDVIKFVRSVQRPPNPVFHNSRAWYDDLRRPAEWPREVHDSFARVVGSRQRTESLELCEKHQLDVDLEHWSPGFSQLRLISRVVCLAKGRAIFKEYYLKSWAAPAGLRSVLDAEYNKLLAQLQSLSITPPGSTDGFLDFSLHLPPYVDGDRRTLNRQRITDYASHVLWLQPPRIPVGSEDPFTVWAGLPDDDGFDQVPPTTPTTTRALRVVQQAEPAYLTIAELYDLRRQKNCSEFVLVRSGLDLEVYDQHILQETLGHSEEQLQQNIEHTSYGRCLNERTANEFRARRVAAEKPRAKVVQWVTPEEVCLQDGKEGRRTWITAGDQVYDITDLSLYPADDKLHRLLLSKPGGNPMIAVDAGGYRPREVVKRLLSYRVAMLFPLGLDVAPKQIKTFTIEELGWHQFRETGMYVQIYDDVYDISTVYLDMHPGGVDILSAYAGKDATEAFEKYHPENGKQLLESIQAMKIGRMIKTYQPHDEVEAGEVRLRDRVFRGEEASAAVKDIQGSPTEEFEAALKHMADGGDDEPIVTLWNKHQDLIVGKYVTPYEALSTMTDRQLQAFDGQTIDSCFENAAYMAVDDTVYDITTLLQFGHPTVVSRLRPYAGKTCTSKGVARIMKTFYAFRAVARLSEHEQQDGPSWDPRWLRHDIADADLQKLSSQIPKEVEKTTKKRKFGERGCGAEMSFRDPPSRVKKPVAEPVADGERPAKRRAAEPMSLWLDWRTEGLVDQLQRDFASGKLFAEWQAKEMERDEDETGEMEGFWEKAREEGMVGA